MYHTHFSTIHSTQIYLRDNLVELKTHDDEILITTSEQTLGIGRKGSQWDSYANSLAMSFTMKPNPVPTLTPIEIGVLAIEFLKSEYNISIKLKWPNDLLTTEGKKCGGIIAQYINTETVIAGLGLNLGSLPVTDAPAHYKHGLGNVSDAISLQASDQKDIPAKLYQFILKHRISDTADLQARFYNACIHIEKMVNVDDDGDDYTGKFMGIGKNGEALVEIDNEVRSFLASSLKILN
ncbi:biotin--[acetyl-CoA-carboxylase] ligase [Bacteriovorax sp. PP10]|uniref:Biotin--[acetyl-CoA-carboxylase] ligase n=1 Tax=Bacteriovorax antarcticus TaxID=3088717 RepID=A0ABU5VPP1_9BACT|nr:biotin--[acetyl-CoA-carboxylase] ligase [Bacteriovorax sp. PP10]MEA9355012.1 biotin--[acetyl-CoA-carboxylase] ligase [Bacteriovorax sp. PP10]